MTRSSEETIDEILGVRIIQKRRGYRVSIDAFLLASFVLPLKRGERVLDVGTGSAIIPLLLAQRSEATFTGVEIQEELYRLALRNVELNGLSKRIEVIRGDFREVLKGFGAGTFDLILANPPYRKRGAARPSPYRDKAIAHYEELWDMEAFLEDGMRILKGEGRISLLYHVERLPELFRLVEEKGLFLRRMRFAHPKRGRKGEVFLLEVARKGGPFKVEPPVFLEDGAESLFSAQTKL